MCIRDRTILLSSHVFEETERTCGRAAILRKGRLAVVEDMELSLIHISRLPGEGRSYVLAL